MAIDLSLLPQASPSLMSLPSRAEIVWHLLCEARRESDQLTLHQAALLHEMLDQHLYRERGYHTFKEAVRVLHFKPRKAYQLAAVHRKYVFELKVPEKDLAEIGWSKLAEAEKFVTAENVTEFLPKLQESSLREIRSMVRGQRAPKPTPIEPPSAEVVGPAETDGPSSSQVIGQMMHGLLAYASRKWSRLPPPDPREFHVARDVWEQLCYAAARGENVLLIGDSGSGKSELCRRVAEASGRKFHAFNFGGMGDARASLVGQIHLHSDGTHFYRSRFVGAIQEPDALILADEINRGAGRSEATNLILPLLDGQGYLALDEQENAPVVHRADGVVFFATANVGRQYTTDQIDKALQDRFPITIHLDYPPSEHEERLLLHRCPGLEASAARRLVQLADEQRRRADEGDYQSKISTRSLLAAGRQAAAGIELVRAMRFCLVSQFSKDGGTAGEQFMIEQLIQKH